MKKRSNISDKAVLQATGKTRGDWFKILDKAGAKKMSHKDIARLLWDKKLIMKDWWCQMVTVEYEYARGKRVAGETADVGFEIGVTKTLPISKKQAWDLLMSPTVRKMWLGETNVTVAPGNTYATKEGTTGEVRTLRPGERVRLTWQPKGFKQPSTLQVTVSTRQTMKGTCIRFHQEKLASAKDRVQMRKHWQQVLMKLEELIED
ncbi:MAG: SRPBCC domain-containing protein [Candidatus Andersenbacteria bacterium]|nr:SRPBCC domain-containing protein [Candidatus Andersenbacteria bacterium]